jgi:hypothetical protein
MSQESKGLLMTLKNIAFLLLLPAVVAGCAGKYVHTLDYNTAEPIRVAVLPFYQVDKNGKILEADPNIALDKVPLLSRELEERPGAIVQKHAQTVLGRTGMDIVPPAAVEALLSHNGFVDNGIKDFKKLRSVDPKALCQLLTCDALLYGEVTEWDRSYYGVQTVNSVGVKVRLVRAADRKELFSASAADTESRGLTKIPTGISSAVLEPIKGLDNEIISNLARDVVDKMFQPLFLRNRPEFLNSFPPVILASSHDAQGGAMSRSTPLTVLMLGSPKKIATFSVGRSIENIPMVERDEGHYVGEYYPLPSDSFSNQTVKVSLEDQYGRVSEQIIGVGPVTLQ